MSFAVSILEYNVEAIEVFVSHSITKCTKLNDTTFIVQDNSGALLQDEEYVITEDLRSGM